MLPHLKMTNNCLWALAPQFADNIFSALKEEAGGIKGLTAQDRDFAAMISRRENGVAVISIRGPMDQQTRISVYSHSVYSLGYDAIRSAIQVALDDPLASAILLSIDSPGGSVAGAKELADFIAQSAQIKPIVAYANGLCASAAFWIASATGRIFAPATALVGSIGVIMCVEDWSAWYAKSGIKLEYITSGKFKAAGQDGKELAEDERKYFEDQIGAIHTIFKNDVRSSLALAAEEILWGEAQLMLAGPALELGLVSRIVRDESEAIQLLAPQTEEIMEYTLEALQKNAPDLLAQVQEEAFAKGKASIKDDDSLALAVMKVVCNTEQVEACEKMLAKAKDLGLSAKQVGGFSECLGLLPTAENPQDDRKSRLDAIISAHEPPVNSNLSEVPAKSRLLADAERRNGGIK